MTSIFDKIKAAKAGTAGAPVPPARQVTPILSRVTAQAKLPPNVRVEPAPEPEIDFDSMQGMESGEYDEDDDDDDDGADDAYLIGDGEPEETTVPAAVPVAPPPARLRLSAGQRTKEPAHLSAPSAPSDAPAPTRAEPAPRAPRAPVIDPSSPLGRLRAASIPGHAQTAKDAAEVTKSTSLGMTLPKSGQSAAMSGLSANAREFIEDAKVEKIYSVEQYLADWRELDDLPDDADHVDLEKFNNERAEIIRKACARIQQIFDAELKGLSVAAAGDFSLTEISNIVKLTFLRVKETPGAYAVLDLADRAQLIKGMRAMAAKRNSSVKNVRPKEAEKLSQALDAMGIGAEDDADFGGFDLTGFGL